MSRPKSKPVRAPKTVLERQAIEWTALAGEQRHRAEELERENELLRAGTTSGALIQAKERAAAAEALLVEVREEMNRRLRAAEDRDAVLNTEISGLQAKLAEANERLRLCEVPDGWEAWRLGMEAKLAEAQAGSDLAVTNLRDALAAEREKARAIHAMLEKFADDLDTGPSTHLLATELRNRWRALRDEPENPPVCYCTGDGHKSDCAFWMSLKEPKP